MLHKLFTKNQPTADRRRRLMGNLLDIFDPLEGKTWATALGAIIIIVLIAMSFLPEDMLPF